MAGRATMRDLLGRRGSIGNAPKKGSGASTTRRISGPRIGRTASVRPRSTRMSRGRNSTVEPWRSCAPSRAAMLSGSRSIS
jgi:hypothetical protein